MNKAVKTSPKEPAKKHKKLLDDTRVRFVIAVISAMFTWLLVVTVIAPDSYMVIDNVPVNFSYNTSQYTNLGYTMMNDPSATVSIKVSGERTVIGSLTKEDFVVYPDYSNVLNSGENSLKLLVKSLATNASDFTVEISSDNTSAVVVFDTVETVSFPITLSGEGISIEDGYLLISTTQSISEVEASGPTSELDQISQVVAEYIGTEVLAGNTTLSANLRFLDSDGNDVEFVYMEAEQTQIDVTLVVNKYAALPVTVNFINTPSNFDASVLDYSFNHETLIVSGDAKTIDSMKEISVGTIDLSTFALDKVYEMEISLPSGIILQENINVITVSFDCSEMATKTLNVSAENIIIENLPDNYQIEIESSRIMNVTLCGPADVMESLAASSVIATINVDDFSIALGMQTVSVSISVPSDGRVFAIGSYTVACKIESN
ncbi:MAG: hypothetical protein R3Y06_11435 [Faecalibacterium sp.]